MSDAEVVNTASESGGRCVPKWIGRGSPEPIQRAKGWERPPSGRSQPLQGDRWRARRTSQFYLQNHEVLLTPLCGGAGTRRHPQGVTPPDSRVNSTRKSALPEHGQSVFCGGAGNRTRVLRYRSRASPGAACCAFLSPDDHTGKSSTGSVTV